ncbi:hypothetical protein ACWGID_13100, partial [Kribbella sp. NPDC054772]
DRAWGLRPRPPPPGRGRPRGGPAGAGLARRPPPPPRRWSPLVIAIAALTPLLIGVPLMLATSAADMFF